MFFITYLRRELSARMRQAVFIALGLALGVGLFVTVTAASVGVQHAQAEVLSALYGVGTDVTVTGSAVTPLPEPFCQPGLIWTSGHCVDVAGHTFDRLFPPLLQGTISASAVPAVARLHDVAAAVGVLTLTAQSTTYPAGFGTAGSVVVPQVASFTVDGVAATGHTSAGPLATATIISGHSFSAADSGADVALADTGYAASSNLNVGSTISIGNVDFTVIGLVTQPGSSPPDVYIPLARAQALATPGKDGNGGSLPNRVNLIYVAAASAADIPAVQSEMSRLLPHDTVTAAVSLAGQVSGSLSSAARLASDLGTWMSVLALIAAFALASLLTMAAVARRSGEFGTLKVLGWRSRRIIAQVLGELAAMGLAGAAAGIGLGLAGAAIIGEDAPRLSATDASAIGSMQQALAPQGSSHQFISHAVLVPLSPSITVGVIVLAVIVALLGSLLAGAFGSWRIARLHPADALARVA
jgi:putative ABC transport system permease protein